MYMYLILHSYYYLYLCSVEEIHAATKQLSHAATPHSTMFFCSTMFFLIIISYVSAYILCMTSYPVIHSISHNSPWLLLG